MDVYKFINSKDIREHCRKLGHKFNAIESAVLVWLGDWHHTLREKHLAWQEIIDTMPDMALECGSAHQCIRRYMEIEDRLVKDFCGAGPGIYFQGGEGALDCETHYETLAEFIMSEKSLQKEYNEGQDENTVWARAMDELAQKRARENGLPITPTFSVYKETPDGYAEATFRDETFELLDIFPVDCPLMDHLDKLDAEFYDTFFEDMPKFFVPTPFQKGDIVTLRGAVSPGVLEELCFWEDTLSDMFLCGLISFHTGGIQDVQFGNWGCCLDLEYYRGELTGRARVFTAISNYLKGKIDLVLLLTAYRTIMNEELQRQEREIVIQGFTDKGLRLAGLENLTEKEAE